jgi:uroporphyrinogen decarboxylase
MTDLCVKNRNSGRTFDDIRTAVTNKSPGIVPLYEHFVDDEIIQEIMGYDFAKEFPGLNTNIKTLSGQLTPKEQMSGQVAVWTKKIEFYRQMGYVYVPVEFPPAFAATPKIETSDTAHANRGKREWINEHLGIVAAVEDLENPAVIPPLDRIFDYPLFENIAALVPEGMKIIGGFAGGPMEHSLYLMGFEHLLVAIHENEELVERLYAKLRTIFTTITARLAEMKEVGILRVGDDLGFRSGPFMSPECVRKHIFPIHADIVGIAHRAGKPFILHSCGNTDSLMNGIIEDCRFDAKHSFEDAIEPIEVAKKKWGKRIALLGGVDMGLLCRASCQEIKERTKRIMDLCSRDGGFAIGSGSSVSNYIPVDHYLSMLEAAREFNGQA